MTSENCFICGCISSEYAELPNGDVVPVCSEHVCEDGKIHIWPAMFDYKQLADIYSQLDQMSSCSPYLARATEQAKSIIYDWMYPCYTCDTRM